MSQLTTVNRISIAEICIYSPSLIVAIALVIRHGFKRSSGWLFLILFSVIRLLGAALELATINPPNDISLTVCAMTLQAAGLSPLILVMVGLLGRVITSINKTADSIIKPKVLQAVGTLTLVGLILSIVGGSKLGDNISEYEAEKSTQSGTATASSPASVAIPTESQAGIGLMIAGFGILVGATAAVALQVRRVEKGERRILCAVAAVVPFVLVRLTYSAMATYNSTNPDFRWFAGSPNYAAYLIGMSVAMEMCAIAIVGGVGLTLRQLPRAQAQEGVPPLGTPSGRELSQSRELRELREQKAALNASSRV